MSGEMVINKFYYLFLLNFQNKYFLPTS